MNRFSDYIEQKSMEEQDVIDKLIQKIDPQIKQVLFRLFKGFVLAGVAQVLLELSLLTPSSVEHKLIVAIAVALVGALEKFLKVKLNYTTSLKKFCGVKE